VNPPLDLVERVEALVGARVTEARRATGGYSLAERWTLRLDSGEKVFAKMAPTDELAIFLRSEHRNMTSFDADFRCDVIAFQDGDRPLLILEDLSHAYWPPEWRPGDVDRVRATLRRVAALPAGHLQSADRIRELFGAWEKVARDPRGFLSLRVGSRDWLDACLPTLQDAARSARFVGDDFVHMDVRSDNLCFEGDRCVLVDWNWAVRGDADLDVACWAPALRLEGGPLPEEIAPGQGAYASGISSFFAEGASLPPPAGAPTVRRFQLRQLRISLPWACRELGLPQPDVPYGREEIAELDRARDAAEIDEATWYERTEEVLIDAYLASDDPRAQSGKGGDEDVWRWARELVLDVFPGHATFLDVGCANGYLMESVVRWGAQRGITVEPYGLDISWRIAALARHRLPRWRDRISTGNVIDWTPPMRFDVVQAGLDEVPPARRRELVDRILERFLVPGGTLVFRANRVIEGEPNIVDQLRAIGLRPDGVIEAEHPTEGTRRTVWLSAPVD
jgi:SAM-dependent methyltransferase